MAGVGIDKAVTEESVESLETISTTQVAELVVQLKERIGVTKISPETIHLVLKAGMELVENSNYVGVEKREKVIEIVRIVIIDLVENPDEERLLLQVIDTKILENTISLVILASKGELDLNNKKTKKTFISCMQVCVPLTLDTILHLVKACRPKKKPTNNNQVEVTIVKQRA